MQIDGSAFSFPDSGSSFAALISEEEKTGPLSLNQEDSPPGSTLGCGPLWQVMLEAQAAAISTICLFLNRSL